MSLNKNTLSKIFLSITFALLLCFHGASVPLHAEDETKTGDEYTGPAEDTYGDGATDEDKNTINFENMFSNGLGTEIEDKEKFAENMNKILMIAKVSLNGLIGVGLMICVFAFSVQAFSLAAKGKIPGERAKIINNLLILAISTAGLGGFPLLFSIVMMLLAG